MVLAGHVTQLMFEWDNSIQCSVQLLCVHTMMANDATLA